MKFRERLCSPRRRLVLMLVAALSWDVPASPAAQPAVTKPPAAEPQTAASAMSSTQLKQQLESAQRKLGDQRAGLEMAIRKLGVDITRLEQALKQQDKPETKKQKDKLVAEREAQSKRLDLLERTVEAWQKALEHQEDQKRSEQQIVELDERTEKFAESDLPVFESQVSQTKTTLEAQQSSLAQLNSRITEVDKQLEKAEIPERTLLEAEKAMLEAEAAKQAQQQAALEKQLNFLTARLELARRQFGVVAPAKTKGPTPEELQKLEAKHRQRLAEREQAEARDQLKHAVEQHNIRKQRRDEAAKGENVDDLENEVKFWERKVTFAERAKDLGDLNDKLGKVEKELDELQQKRNTAVDEQKKIPGRRAQMSQEERVEQAETLRASASVVRQQADAVWELHNEERNKIPAILQYLVTWEAELEANDKQRDENLAAWDHCDLMEALLDDVGRQISLLITTQKLYASEILEKFNAIKKLADVHETSADIWDPPVKPFLEQHADKVFAGIVVVAALVLTYVLTLLGNGLVALYAVVNARTRPDLSVKRFKTLQGFAQSILKIFVWIFALVWILDEFGVDPAKATGALGLIGLILAGMFQQIVIDFVKGIDIIAGRHYDVGDFVEVAGNFGHVVDFSAKYTCIRTASGEIISLPNSKCIPSRRFPDGYVDNYVDIPLADWQGRDKAKAIIDGVCRETNERIEVVKEEPRFITQFVAADGKGVILRYRVRMLPGCEWVLRDYFMPRVKQGLEDIGVSMTGEISFVLINNVERFRKLFSRQLAEAEILREAHPERAAAGDEQESEDHTGEPAVKRPVEQLQADPK